MLLVSKRKRVEIILGLGKGPIIQDKRKGVGSRGKSLRGTTTV